MENDKEKVSIPETNSGMTIFGFPVVFKEFDTKISGEIVLLSWEDWIKERNERIEKDE